MQLGWTKLERMATALELQQDVLFVDLDIVWMANPLPSLQVPHLICCVTDTRFRQW